MTFAHLEADAEWEGKGDEDYGPGYGGEHPATQPDTVVAVISWNNKQHCKYISSEGSTANEGPVSIQCQCLVPIYVFPEMKQPGLVISKAAE